MFEDTRLRIFATVARTGSYTAAAREVGVTQPAVSQNIAELEKVVGEPLFVRSSRRMRLTAKGEQLLQYVSKILWWYSKAEAVCIKGTEPAPEPAVLDLGGRKAEVTSVDGGLEIRIV